LLEGQRAYIDTSDLAICHQETPVAAPGGPFSAYPSFNVPPQIVTAAKDVGYQACTTASNHTIDRGTAGLVRTLDALDAAGLKHTGSYRTEAESQGVLLLQTEAATIAVIEATYGLNGQYPEYVWQVDMLDAQAMIAKAKKARALGADIVLGAMHAGDEYASAPNAQQQDTAHALVDSGEFTMVYGHHTHSVLPIENYKGTWIVYGLGNGVTELSPWYVVNNEGLLVPGRRRKMGGLGSGVGAVCNRPRSVPLVFSGSRRAAGAVRRGGGRRGHAVEDQDRGGIHGCGRGGRPGTDHFRRALTQRARSRTPDRRRRSSPHRPTAIGARRRQGSPRRGRPVS
jgi:hypothetical protein